ncbi:MAG: thermostable hemolysin [Betaproteobacteria bacterium]|nr:thermostable hemolysin [Betaproteobacteria bacterium]MCC6247387.1 thermostable hemolysin [Rubrivivax sp.]
MLAAVAPAAPFVVPASFTSPVSSAHDDRTVGSAATLRLHGHGTPDRAAVESFIRTVFRERFAADVRHFAPMLVSLADANGEVVAAAGYRGGDAGPLFLERYLDTSADMRLSQTSAALVPRRRIVEVGHLGSARAGAGRVLIARLGAHLAAAGFQWVVGTLTQELRHLFLRLGIAPVALGFADPALLGDEAVHWGRYYDHRPVVLAGNLELALQALARRGGAA